jgi:hypothetical protein
MMSFIGGTFKTCRKAPAMSALSLSTGRRRHAAKAALLMWWTAPAPGIEVP